MLNGEYIAILLLIYVAGLQRIVLYTNQQHVGATDDSSVDWEGSVNLRSALWPLYLLTTTLLLWNLTPLDHSLPSIHCGYPAMLQHSSVMQLEDSSALCFFSLQCVECGLSHADYSPQGLNKLVDRERDKETCMGQVIPQVVLCQCGD